MTNRSAHATIKGYFYQFDHTIVRLLDAATPQSSVVVEGIEDIDLDDGADSALVQCKYYEGSEYNHSVIKDAVIHMFRHFHGAGCQADQTLRYRIYGYFKEGQEKLASDFDLDFLKKHFLTYKHEKITHEVHTELGVVDAELKIFHDLLDIDLNAPSYETQQKQVIDLLVTQISGCNLEDADTFYYPNAINVIQSLAIQPEEIKRKITKGEFVSQVNRKEIVFSVWLQQKFGDDYYARLIKRRYFKPLTTKIHKASRIFVIDISDEFDLSKATPLLAKIGSVFSHVEHKRTPATDRFCPYVLLHGVEPQDMVLLKGALLKQGIKFEDGYPFHGAAFDPDHLTVAPTKDNLIKLKFIPTTEMLAPVISTIKGTIIELYDFFKIKPLDGKEAPQGIDYHAIKVNSAYLIREAI